MKKERYLLVFLLLTAFIILRCATQETAEERAAPVVGGVQQEPMEKQQPGGNAPAETDSEPQKDEKPSFDAPWLSNLCQGEEKCLSFCQNNRGQCEEYCRGNHDNELCRIIFPPEEEKKDSDRQENSGCSGQGTVTFTSPPMPLGDIELIEPIGLMIGGHVTPIDHGYYYAKGWVAPGNREDTTKFRDVLAPASGIVTSVESMPEEYSSSSIGDYRIIIYHTCTFYTIYIHINQLSEKLRKAADTREKVAVKAGEVIGKAPGFDFSVHDDEITLPGFVVPESYVAEPWKLHNVDMFNYFAEPTRTQLLDKNVRQKEPRGGKIDHDIDGKLVGNWFEENTNGYFGKAEYQRLSGYWSTHLAFAYDGLDPSLLIVSMGDYDGEAQQFAVKGNAPDPKEVDKTKGIIKYELVRYGYLTDKNEEWSRQNFAKIGKAYGHEEQVEGVVLVEMISDRKIKFEAFPGKTASTVNGFTEKAKIYVR
ncbi:TPA: M23 family metallopeptidase [Candidatus Woesearchaeota archaeon]|nr:hypothetical protein [Candidatus Woesearchaeota archaeon]HIG92673.1 M23 family metallopeptidase [Candidatus Woesearchaeota archaeon]HIH13456.1 M23 family metallopeptidase [Candidatus Woesearchaeota archaeon]